MLPSTTLYHQRLAIAREALRRSDTVLTLMDDRVPTDTMLSWLIEFTTRGVRMTEPVEGWIRRAGERCNFLGFESIGRPLEKHAAQERDHHLLMIEDARQLVARWNTSHEERLDVDALLDRPLTDSMASYIGLHEGVIAGDMPFLQVAIEREIEGLSLAVGPTIVERCRKLLGDEGLGEISFITDHVELDVAHTAFNEKLLAKVLEQRPDAIDALIDTGVLALECYLGFMTDCFVDRP